MGIKDWTPKYAEGGVKQKNSKVNFSKYFKLDLSFFLLIFSNILIIVFALIDGASLGAILLIYLFQSIIIGFFNFFKIWNLKNFTTDHFRINRRAVEPTVGTKRFTAIFFAFHYGIFHIAYFSFLAGFLNFGISSFWIFVFTASFFISHFISYKQNKENDAKKRHNIGKVMFFPYARIFPMHLTIVFGLAFINSQSVLLFFLILKTIADLIMHQIEHAK
jgi:hypothetical protein